MNNRPSQAFVIASWGVLGVGVVGFLIGLWNAEMGIEEKGYYFAVLALGLFAAVSIQKSVRDRMEKVKVSDLYLGICWAGVVTAVGLLTIGLYNATNINLAEKGFYGMAFTLCMFSAVTVQKNVRDTMAYDEANPNTQRIEIVDAKVAKDQIYS